MLGIKLVSGGILGCDGRIRAVVRSQLISIKTGQLVNHLENVNYGIRNDEVSRFAELINSLWRC